MSKIVGLILSGGEGRRLGGINKGLVNVEGKPLVQWVYDALVPQVDRIFISANDDIDQYRCVCADILEDSGEFCHKGPLAGIHSLTMHVDDHDIVQIMTCDLPLLPIDLVARQLNCLTSKGLDAVYPKDHVYEHYGLLMFKGALIHHVTELLQQDQRRIRDFIAMMHCGALFFENSEAFINGNDWQSIEKIARILKERVC